jgi:N-acetylglucosaminyl-diphospho-decaprenol L-rhamnosyltransferase
MDISIIIVSYNTAQLTMDCLTSLQTCGGLEKEIFVVDNCSTDNSVALIRERFPAVKVIANQLNRGFGAANNQALPHCLARYVIFLNPDTTICKDTLQKAVFYMDENLHIGLAGAKILNPDGTLQPSVSYRYPGEKFADSELAGLAGKIACVMGAFMIARKELITQIGGFDEDFFLYGEDQDLCWRIRQKGFSIGHIEEARVYHWGGQSEAQTPPAAIYAKKIKAEYLFYQKHYLPATINRIKKAQRIKARYRLATLKLLAFFVSNKKQLQNKIDIYKITLSTAQDGN